MKNIILNSTVFRVCITALMTLFGSQGTASAVQSLAIEDSIAFWYAANAPLSELAQFDYLVLEAAHFDASALSFLHSQNTQLFAYLSIGEFNGNKQDLLAADLSNSTSNTVNHAWDSHVMNLADHKWQNHLIARAKHLHELGYNGLFLDTLDSFQLLPAEQRAQQRKGLIQILSKLQIDTPELALIFNRGFEVVHELPKKPAAVAIESIYSGWNPNNNRYIPVTDNDRAWLKQHIDPIRAKNIPLIAIEYLPFKRRDEARALIKKLQSEGFISYVGTPHLNSLGISSIEVQPRRLAVLYDGRKDDFTLNNGHAALAGLLEYLGYRVDYFSVDQPLPEHSMPELYAGVISWIGSGSPVDSSPFYAWLNRRLDEKIPLVFFGSIPIENAALLERMGLRMHSGLISKKLNIDHYEAQALGHFEAPLRMRTRGLQPVFSVKEDNTALLQLSDPLGKAYQPVMRAPWGGYALDPYVLESSAGHSRWIIDPFVFLQHTLRLPDIPRVDSTTENGRRIATVHIDGDGFPLKAEIAETPYAGQSVLDAFLKAYPLLTSVSVIEGEVGPKGKHPDLSPTLEEIARKIFALDTVEVASHTYSHPFFWHPETAQNKNHTEPQYAQMMNIPGYDSVDYTREVIGSIDYINERLTTPEKPVKVFFWSGDALPDAATIKLAYDKGVMNINGAVTAVKPSNPSMTGIHALLRPTEGGIQYYAPITNESIYTNSWNGPYYGFRDLIFTYQFTDHPRRLRGMHLYYHFYSGTKQASIKTIKNIYQYMLDAEPFSLWMSQYIPRLTGLHEASLARRTDGSWQIKGLNKLRTVRIDPEMGWPNLLKSQAVAGVRDLEQGRYIILSSDQAVLHLQAERDSTPSLEHANIPLLAWRYSPSNKNHGNKISFSFAGEFPLTFTVRYHGSCYVQMAGKRYNGLVEKHLITFNMPFERVSDATLICH